MSLLIKSALLDQKETDLYIEGRHIKHIAKDLSLSADRVINAKGKAIIPGLVNAHTHAAMTLFRGFGDDMKLMPWLEQKIWPNEAKLTPEDVYWGTKLACLEMIKSGTTAFFDMYHFWEAAADAVEEMGIRAVLAGVCFDHFQPAKAEKSKKHNKTLLPVTRKYGNRIHYAIGPHAIYTVSGELLQWIDRFSEENQVLVHLHLAETKGEVDDSLARFGSSPVRYLHKLGVLSPRLVVAHGIYMDDEEIHILADHGVKVVHNPASNMKLGSGAGFKYAEMRDAGVTVGLGTDGCSSSNNLDMIEAMKLASLLGKTWRMDPEAVTAGQIFRTATADGATILGLADCGRIEEGCLADLSLIDLRIPAFTPNFNFISNLVYAANGSCVDTVICDGKILMENKHVPGEEEIMDRTSRIAYDLIAR